MPIKRLAASGECQRPRRTLASLAAQFPITYSWPTSGNCRQLKATESNDASLRFHNQVALLFSRVIAECTATVKRAERATLAWFSDGKSWTIKKVIRVRIRTITPGSLKYILHRNTYLQKQLKANSLCIFAKTHLRNCIISISEKASLKLFVMPKPNIDEDYDASDLIAIAAPSCASGAWCKKWCVSSFPSQPNHIRSCRNNNWYADIMNTDVAGIIHCMLFAQSPIRGIDLWRVKV